MNVLWDFRLLSLGYRDRGVGRVALSMAQAIVDTAPPFSILVWGDRRRALPAMEGWAVQWIPYDRTNWKVDLLSLPIIIARHRVHLIHYWVALGPLRNVSMAPRFRAPAVGLVHDLGVELWDGVPFLTRTRASLYWKTQRLLARGLGRVVCTCDSTRASVAGALPYVSGRDRTIYPPLEEQSAPAVRERAPWIVTLGGSPHKNVRGVIEAFARVKERFPDHRLVILGDLDTAEEGIGELPPGVSREPMDRYEYYLERARVLAVCSFHEGLGLPALDGMRYGCPLLLSDIPQFRESAAGAAAFARPDDIEGMASGMADLIDRSEYWSGLSRAGARRYRQMSGNCGEKWRAIYGELVSGLGKAT